jgi:hypothetical protein
MAENTAGYLALEIKVDDSNVAAEIAEASGKAQAQLDKLGGSLGKYSAITQDAIRRQKAMSEAAQESHARFGVMANSITGASTAMRLLGSEVGMAGVEMGRMVLYMGRAITSGGGVTAALVTMAVATRAFVAEMGFLLPILIAAATAYTLYQKTIGAAKEAKEADAAEAKRSGDELAASSNVVLKALIREKLAKKEISELDAAKQMIVAESSGGESEKTMQNRFKAAEIDDRVRAEKRYNDTLQESWEWTEKLNREERNRVYEMEKRIRLAIDEQRQAQKEMVGEVEAARSRKFFADQDEAGKRAAAKAEAEYAAMIEKRNEGLRDLALDFGGKKPSDFLTGEQREMALFRESAAERLKAAGESGTGFGISTREASGFRFGPGAVGSVIGEQSEQKNTTKAIKDLERTIVREFEAKWPNVTGPQSAWNGP